MNRLFFVILAELYARKGKNVLILSPNFALAKEVFTQVYLTAQSLGNSSQPKRLTTHEISADIFASRLIAIDASEETSMCGVRGAAVFADVSFSSNDMSSIVFPAMTDPFWDVPLYIFDQDKNVWFGLERKSVLDK